MRHLPPVIQASDPNLPMRGPFTASFLGHCGLFLGITILAWANTRSVQRQAHDFVDQIAKQERRDAAQARKAERDAAAELARNRLRMEVADLVSSSGRTPEADQLIADTGGSLSDLFQDGGDAGDEPDYEQQRLAALDRVQADAERLLKEALVAQVRQYVRDEVAPELRERIDRQLKDQAGAELQKQVGEGVRQDKAERLRQAARELKEKSDELGKQRGEIQQAKGEAERGDAKAASDRAGKARDAVTAAEAGAGKTLANAAANDPASAAHATEAAADHSAQAATDQAARGAGGERQAAAKDLAAADAALEQRQQALARLAQELESHAGNQGAVDDAQRLAAAAAKDAIDPKLRERVTKEITDKAIPEAANRIGETVARELEQVGIARGQFEDLLRDDIAKALAAELDGSAAAASAWRRTDRDLGTDPGADLARARDAASAAAAKLAELALRQDQLRAQAGDPSAANEDALAADASAAERSAADALAQARGATLAADGEIDRGLEPLRRQAGSDSARRAAQAARVKDAGQAGTRMDEAARNLRDESERMGQVAAAIEREQAAHPTHPMSAHADGAATGAARAGAAIAGKAQGALDAAARAVDTASAQFQPGKVLGDAASLARMRELEEALAQAKRNAAEGRAPGSPQLFAVPGAGAGPMKGAGSGRGRRATFNREAYESFVKDLRTRTNPDNAYAPVAEVTGLDSVAEAERGPFPAVVWAPKPDAPEPAKPAADGAKPAERTVPEPTFKHVAFGAAAMMTHPVTIDGDLSDWGELTNAMTMGYHDDGTRLENGPKIYMRWSNEGIYIGYAIQDPTGIQPNAEASYSGDCCEMWLDMENARRDLMAKSQFTHQFCLDPFGFKGDAKATFVEIGRDQRGLKMFQQYADSTGKRGVSAAKVIPGGYSVEAFIPRTTLSKPVLVPGAYLAVNFSISVDYDESHEVQWSASKRPIDTWNRPDTWGDVLLLGADATVRALDMDGAAIERVVPGQALQVEVADADMDMDPTRPDRVMASVGVKDGGDPVLVVLKETGPDTGVFRGSLNTASYLDEPRKNTVPVRPGDLLEIVYDDPRGAYGEQGRRVLASIPVAHPVMRLAAAH